MIYLSIGSNLGNRLINLSEGAAVIELGPNLHTTRNDVSQRCSRICKATPRFRRNIGSPKDQGNVHKLR